MIETFSTFSTLLFVMDPLGNIPVLLAILKPLDTARQRKIILRDMLIALLIMLLFLYFGDAFLGALQVDHSTVKISGAIVLFIIAIRMIFPTKGGIMGEDNLKGEPFIVPIAIPMVAGPSVLALLMLMARNAHQDMLKHTLSLALAWFICAIIFLLAPALYRLLKERGLIAIERLMGMILIMLAMQMMLDGVVDFIRHH